MSSSEVLVVSDTHLSPRTPPATANWDAVLSLAEEIRPELVVHLGDVTLDGSSDPGELHLARRQLDRLSAPWLAIPGNHDVGDNPGPGVPDAWRVDARRVGHWLDALGSDHFHVEVAGVHLVGINGMLAGSGLDAEAHQWEWLEETVASLGADATVVLASHKPIDGPAEELADASSSRYAPPDARRRLGALLGRVHAPLVLSGHVHQQRMLTLGGRMHAWAPTTWAVLPDETQPPVGAKRCGVLVVTVEGGRVDARMVEPPGIGQHTLGRDIANPYRAADRE